MFFHDKNNNILISGGSSSGGYQDEYENWDLFKVIKIFFWVGTKNKKTDKLVVHITHTIINIWKKLY